MFNLKINIEIYFFVLVYLFLEYIYFPVFFCARQTNKKEKK